MQAHREIFFSLFNMSEFLYVQNVCKPAFFNGYIQGFHVFQSINYFFLGSFHTQNIPMKLYQIDVLTKWQKSTFVPKFIFGEKKIYQSPLVIKHFKMIDPSDEQDL